MTNIKLLFQEKTDLVSEAKSLLSKAKAEGRELNGVERSRLETVKREIEDRNRVIVEEEDRMQTENKDCSRRLDRHGNSFPPTVSPNAHISRESGDRASGNCGFASIGDFMGALFRKTQGDYDERLRMAASIGESDDASGGFAVPPQYIADALEPDFDLGGGEVLLNLCDRVVMTSPECHCPGFADAAHSTSAPYGITWSQVVESGSFGAAQVPPFKKVLLVAKKCGALFAVSNEWLSDVSGAMQQRLQAIFGASLRWYIENRFWNGQGAGEPLGVLKGSGTLSVPKETGQTAKTILTENIVNLWARLRPGSHSRAVWVANPTTFPQLATLTVGCGTGGALTGLLQTNNSDGGVAGQPATAIFGRPLYLSEHMPALGTAGDIVLLDPKLYLFGDRQQITLDASAHVNFSTDETMFRAKARFDGQPALSSVLTPYKGDTVAGAVMIAAR